MPLVSKEINLDQEIMSTDISIKVFFDSDKITELKADEALEKSLFMFRDFESRFSRFLENSLLNQFNNQSGFIKISDGDFWNLLFMSANYYALSDGLFDVGILPYLKNEGYVVSKKKGFVSNDYVATQTRSTLKDLIFNPDDKSVYKPENLQIDFGGLGKGYIVDKVSSFLKTTFESGCVNAGGDLFCWGVNPENSEDFWRSDISNPFTNDRYFRNLKIRDLAVATSGTLKRTWKKSGETKTHIIDPRTSKSTKSEIVSVTVISDSTLEAEIYAKMLILKGWAEAKFFCEEYKLSVIMVDVSSHIYESTNIQKHLIN